jgi:hypothetical protein
MWLRSLIGALTPVLHRWDLLQHLQDPVWSLLMLL